MDFPPDIPGVWAFLKSLVLVLAGGAGVMAAGWWQANSDNKRTRSDTLRDRADNEVRRNRVESVFMEGLLKRVGKLELDLERERRTCREDMEILSRKINVLQQRQRDVAQHTEPENQNGKY